MYPGELAFVTHDSRDFFTETSQDGWMTDKEKAINSISQLQRTSLSSRATIIRSKAFEVPTMSKIGDKL